MTPTFTILIGSAGRDTLEATLDSIKRQRMNKGEQPQVIVAFDSFERRETEIAEIRDIVEHEFGYTFTAYNAGYHWYGIEQINHAMRTIPINSSHVMTLGDDDVYTTGAFDILRTACAASPMSPILFKFLAPFAFDEKGHGKPGRQILWDQPRMKRSHISGCCIAAPVDCVDFFPTAKYVEHDFDWMQAILAHDLAAPAVWLDELLVIARP